MKDKKLFVFIGFLFLFSVLFTPTVVAKTKTIKATGDSHVYSVGSSLNYGAEDIVKVGHNTTGYFEGYFFFNLTNKPANIHSARVWINYYFYSGISEDKNVILIEEAWNESTITWDTKPTHGEIITTIYAGHPPQEFTFDVTNYVNGDNLSICLNSTLSEGCMFIHSSESTFGSGAKVVFTRSGETKIDGFPLFLSMIGLGIICFIQFKQYKSRQ